MPRSKLTIAQKLKIHKLRLKHWTYKQIAEKMNIKKGTVIYWAMMYDGRMSSTATKYPVHKVKPAKTYKEYLWEGYQRHHDAMTLATLQRRFPKFYAEKTGNKYLRGSNKYVTIKII